MADSQTVIEAIDSGLVQPNTLKFLSGPLLELANACRGRTDLTIAALRHIHQQLPKAGELDIGRYLIHSQHMAATIGNGLPPSERARTESAANELFSLIEQLAERHGRADEHRTGLSTLRRLYGLPLLPGRNDIKRRSEGQIGGRFDPFAGFMADT